MNHLQAVPKPTKAPKRPRKKLERRPMRMAKCRCRHYVSEHAQTTGECLRWGCPCEVAKSVAPRKAMKRKRARRIDRETPQEKRWKAWVHTRECAGARSNLTNHICGPDYFPIQQCHFRDMTGLGLKASNLQSIPGCKNLNDEYDQTRGPFAAMGKHGKKFWFLARLIEEAADFELEHGHPPTEEDTNGEKRR